MPRKKRFSRRRAAVAFALAGSVAALVALLAWFMLLAWWR